MEAANSAILAGSRGLRNAGGESVLRRARAPAEAKAGGVREHKLMVDRDNQERVPPRERAHVALQAARSHEHCRVVGPDNKPAAECTHCRPAALDHRRGEERGHRQLAAHPHRAEGEGDISRKFSHILPASPGKLRNHDRNSLP
jgi:hypothetical protein